MQGLQHGELRELCLRYVNVATLVDGRLEPFPLTPLLQGNKLQALDMNYNFISACGQNFDHLKDAMAGKHGDHLHTLSLRRCCIGGWRRARAIARGLARNTTLTDVDLGYNGLGAAAQNSGALDITESGKVLASSCCKLTHKSNPMIAMSGINTASTDGNHDAVCFAPRWLPLASSLLPSRPSAMHSTRIASSVDYDWPITS